MSQLPEPENPSSGHVNHSGAFQCLRAAVRTPADEDIEMNKHIIKQQNS